MSRVIKHIKYVNINVYVLRLIFFYTHRPFDSVLQIYYVLLVRSVSAAACALHPGDTECNFRRLVYTRTVSLKKTYYKKPWRLVIRIAPHHHRNAHGRTNDLRHKRAYIRSYCDIIISGPRPAIGDQLREIKI